MNCGFPIVRAGWGIGAVLAVCVLGAGCGPACQVVVLQPDRQGPQQEIVLTSDSAAFHVEPEADALLLSWPLPGASRGRPVFELYLRVPRENERLTGLFYQHGGRPAGCTRVVGGTVRMKGAGAQGGRHRAGELDVRCDDGTRITGRFLAERRPVALLQFADRHAADIKQALAAAGDPRRRAMRNEQVNGRLD